MFFVISKLNPPIFRKVTPPVYFLFPFKQPKRHEETQSVCNGLGPPETNLSQHDIEKQHVWNEDDALSADGQDEGITGCSHSLKGIDVVEHQSKYGTRDKENLQICDSHRLDFLGVNEQAYQSV